MTAQSGEYMIEANGIDICVETFGDRDDPAILLVMGAGASMLLWDEAFCRRLAAAGRFVIRYDNRDTGKTTTCPLGAPNYTLQDMADDGVAILDHFGIEQAHIAGASMGGMITQLIGLNHPERVLTLTPIMSTPNPAATMGALEGGESGQTLSPPWPQVLEALAELGELDWSDRAAVLANRIQTFRALAGSAYPYEEWRDDIFAAEIDRAINFPSQNNHQLAIAQSDLLWHERLGEIAVPTLVIRGTADPILPFDHGEALAAAIPGAKLLTLQGVGHELPTPVHEEVVAAILEHTS